MEVESGLAVGGAGESFFGAGAEYGGEVGRQDTGTEFENFPGGRGGFSQIGSHPDALGALAGKKESGDLHGDH